MISMRLIVLAIVLLTLITPALAVTVDVDPKEIYIVPGGYNRTTVNVTVYGGEFLIKVGYEITEYNEYLDARLLDESGNNLTDWGDKGEFSCWLAPGMYTYILEIKASSDLPLEDTGTINAIGLTFNTSTFVDWDTESVTVYPIPELATIALSAVGLATIGLIVMRRR